MVPEAIEVMNERLDMQNALADSFRKLSSTCGPKLSFLPRIAAGAGVKTICEVGFNAGHSALRWLTHSSAKARDCLRTRTYMPGSSH